MAAATNYMLSERALQRLLTGETNHPSPLQSVVLNDILLGLRLGIVQKALPPPTLSQFAGSIADRQKARQLWSVDTLRRLINDARTIP